MLKAGHYTDLLRQVNELKRQLHLVGKVYYDLLCTILCRVVGRGSKQYGIDRRTDGRGSSIRTDDKSSRYTRMLFPSDVVVPCGCVGGVLVGGDTKKEQKDQAGQVLDCVYSSCSPSQQCQIVLPSVDPSVSSSLSPSCWALLHTLRTKAIPPPLSIAGQERETRITLVVEVAMCVFLLYFHLSLFGLVGNCRRRRRPFIAIVCCPSLSVPLSAASGCTHSHWAHAVVPHSILPSYNSFLFLFESAHYESAMSQLQKSVHAANLLPYKRHPDAFFPPSFFSCNIYLFLFIVNNISELRTCGWRVSIHHVRDYECTASPFPI